MRPPLLLTSNEVQQQAVDAGLPPYAVAVFTGMLQPRAPCTLGTQLVLKPCTTRLRPMELSTC